MRTKHEIDKLREFFSLQSGVSPRTLTDERVQQMADQMEAQLWLDDQSHHAWSIQVKLKGLNEDKEWDEIPYEPGMRPVVPFSIILEAVSDLLLRQDGNIVAIQVTAENNGVKFSKEFTYKHTKKLANMVENAMAIERRNKKWSLP